jgi:uncharacterized protein HemX
MARTPAHHEGNMGTTIAAIAAFVAFVGIAIGVWYVGSRLAVTKALESTAPSKQQLDTAKTDTTNRVNADADKVRNETLEQQMARARDLRERGRLRNQP